MELGEDYIPVRKVGYLSPLPVIDVGPYEFYRMAPDRTMIIMVAVGLQEFSAQDVERVWEPLEKLTAQLIERGADIVVQGGVPLPLLIGRQALARVMERIANAAGVPAISIMHSCVEAAKALGIKKIAAANKFSPSMNQVLGEFFAEGGIELVGAQSRALAPAQFLKMSPEAGADLAYELGRAALQANPEADGLFIGGAAWIALPAVRRLGQEFDRPWVPNGPSGGGASCRKLGNWQPKSGYGRLLELP